MATFRKKCLLLFAFTSMLVISAANTCMADNIVTPPSEDPHYTQAGFFDLHVCNWPDRELFFLAVYSTYQYKDIAKIEVFHVDGKKLGDIKTNKYRIIKKKGSPEKHVFLTHLAISDNPENGWYSALITMKDGKKYRSKDYVVIGSMARATGMDPADGDMLSKPPIKLSWNDVKGADHYIVYIKDGWEKKTIFTSRLIDKSELSVPGKLLEPGGYYTWRIHARDVNGDVLLGDFNLGSLNAATEFGIAD